MVETANAHETVSKYVSLLIEEWIETLRHKNRLTLKYLFLIEGGLKHYLEVF